MPDVVAHGKMSMYADDTALSVRGTDANSISNKLTLDLIAVKKWLNKNKLFINTDKTKIMLIGTVAKLRGV
jgi:ribonuclease P/MRP protein subunit RPP40